MELRVRLNLLLSLILFLALSIGAVYSLGNARRAVVEELRASSELASTLIQNLLGGTGSPVEPGLLYGMLEQLEINTETRHLNITVASSAPLPVNIGRREEPGPRGIPGWFFSLVRPDPASLTRTIEFDGATILITADPTDEISEAWRETRVTVSVMFAVFVGANVVVFLFLGRALTPLQELSRALTGIERGDYASRLKAVGVPELDAISERFNLMAEVLEQSHADNAVLAQRSLAIQEVERRHLAHELHDELGQSITAIKALAVSINERSRSTDQAVAASAATITDISGDIYARVREMMTRLHPVILDELGLLSAVELMVDDWNTRHRDCFCSLQASRDLPPLEKDARIAVYRIVQEALTNIAKHAHASEASIALEVKSGSGGEACIVVDVADNGMGFDPCRERRGLGLVGMQERVNAMNGRLEIDTAPGQGVRITASAPLEPIRQAVTIDG